MFAKLFRGGLDRAYRTLNRAGEFVRIVVERFDGDDGGVENTFGFFDVFLGNDKLCDISLVVDEISDDVGANHIAFVLVAVKINVKEAKEFVVFVENQQIGFAAALKNNIAVGVVFGLVIASVEIFEYNAGGFDWLAAENIFDAKRDDGGENGDKNSERKRLFA